MGFIHHAHAAFTGLRFDFIAIEQGLSDHHVYKKVEIVGSSRIGIEDAINNALAECSKSIQNLEWFEVVETRGHVQHGQVGHYQVVLKVGFKIQGS